MEKLFERIKKISPLEWLVLIVVAFIAVFTVRFFGRGEEWRVVRVEVVGNDWTNTYGDSNDPPYWLAEKVKVGDVERNASGGVIAEVLRVENYEDIEEDSLFLTLRLKTEINERMDKYVYKGKAVEVGTPIELRLNSALIQGQVIDDKVPEEGYETKEIVIRGRLRGRELYFIDEIDPGDTMVNKGNGEVVAEILETQIAPSTSKLLIDEEDGIFKLESSPTKRDLIMTIRIKVAKHGNDWYFAGDQRVKIDSPIHIFLPEANLDWTWVEDIRQELHDS